MFILAPIFSISVAVVDFQIQQVVPDTTIAVVSTDNVSTLVKHMETSGLCDSMDECFVTLRGDTDAESFFPESNDYEAMFESLGIDYENWSLPSGHAGFALYPVVDYEVGSVGLGMFGMIELDERTYAELFTDNFERYLTDSQITVESVNLAGRDVWMVQNPNADQMQPLAFLGDNAFDRGYLVFSDGYLMVGTEPDTLATALFALDGDFESDMLDSNNDFIALVDRCGTGGDVFAGVMLSNLADTIIQMDQSGMSMMFLPMLKTTFGDVDAIAESVSLSPSEDILLDVQYTALMNEGRNGLLGLLGSNVPAQPIPQFVEPDPLTYTQGQIDFDKFIDLVKESIQNNPMLAMQMGPEMDQMEVGLGLFLNPLGSTYHSFSTGQMPYNPESVGHLIAVECTDQEAFANALTLTLPMAGAKVEDFLGNQIFTIDLGSDMPMPVPISLEMSIAIGGGYAIVGTTNTVQNALRRIANPGNDKSSISSNPVASLVSHDNVSSWGFGDVKTSLEIKIAMSEQMSEEMFEDMESFDPEMAAEMRKEFEEQNEIQAAVTQAIASMLGPMAWNMTADETGINATLIMLKPEK